MMKQRQYRHPEIQLAECGLEFLLAESNDAVGADMPIDDIDLTFNM